MEPEKSIEIEHRFSRNIYVLGAHRVILRLSVGHHDIQPIISGATLEDHDQTLGPAAVLDCAEGRARKKARHGGGTDDSKRAITQKNAASWHKKF